MMRRAIAAALAVMIGAAVGQFFYAGLVSRFPQFLVVAVALASGMYLRSWREIALAAIAGGHRLADLRNLGASGFDAVLDGRRPSPDGGGGRRLDRWPTYAVGRSTRHVRIAAMGSRICARRRASA